MSIPVRLAWIAVGLVLLAGGIWFISLDGARSDAEEELEQALAAEARVEQEAEAESERVDDLLDEATGKRIQRQDCLFEIQKQTMAWNQLNKEMPTVFYSTSEVQGYADRAMGLVDDARNAERVCSRI